MAAEGLKKKDMQRGVQKVHLGACISSDEINTTLTTQRVELGFPAEKVTLVTSGDLAANVTPMIGNSNSNAAIAATTTPSTTTTTNMFSAVLITRTSGTGRVLILAK